MSNIIIVIIVVVVIDVEDMFDPATATTLLRSAPASPHELRRGKQQGIRYYSCPAAQT
jgi:hypothetical protein